MSRHRSGAMLAVAAALCPAACKAPVPQAAAEWISPPASLRWERGELLAILALPHDADVDGVRVLLNGQDRTAAFRPPVLGLLGLPPGAEARSPGEGFFLRMLAVLGPTDLRAGDNLLQALVGSAGGGSGRVERHFHYAPAGRRIHCRLVRERGGEVDTVASGRIVLEPRDGAPAVDFSPDPNSADEAGGGGPGRNSTLLRGGEAVFFLPPGRYRAIATGGPLDSLDEWVIPEAGDAEHTFRIRREVDLPGIVTADFHVHAAGSRDSVVPLEERIWSFLAAGVDVLVASDHDEVTDYGPVIARLPPAARRIQAIPGVEASLVKGGVGLSHWNLWPLDPAAWRTDPILPWNVGGETSPTAGAEQMIEALRRRAGPAASPPVVQLNHPRGIHVRPRRAPILREHDWFNKIGYDPDAPVRPAPDFDALEIWNRSSRKLYLEVRRDWFSLLNQGYVRTATANTDTHTVSPELAAYPMNMVFLPPGEAGGAAVSLAALAKAVRAGRVVGTDGPVPLLAVRAAGREAGPGELLPAPGGVVEVSVEVRAASWVPVGVTTVWTNGTVAKTGASGVRLRLQLERDTWILAEVGEPGRGAEGVALSGLYGLVAPRGLALAFTNPVLVDVDGNGRFDPPGPAHSALPPRP